MTTDIVTLDKLYIVAARNAANTFDYGDVISKEWLIKQFAIQKPETGTEQDFNNFAFEFMQNFEKFREILLKEHKKCLRNIRGTGYEVISPSSQSDYAMTTMRKEISSSISKAIDTLTHVNEDLLSLEDIKRRDEQRGKIAAMAAFSRKRIGKSG